ncbi:hypothetical protein HDU81_006949 [Chytriomyces hyalinus]|nr:hypothetical protein HDU81_006949 [Chytriomyces hyalinus]
MNLRRMLSSSPPSLPSLEAVFRLYIPITLSPTSVETLKASDFTLLANFILRTAETHLNMNTQQPLPDPPIQDPTTPKEDKPYDKTYIFNRLIRETTFTAKVELLASIASMMNHLVEKADKPSSSLPSIFNSFSKLILSDIGRVKPKQLTSNTAIPTLAMLRTISNENEAAVFLTQLDAFIGKRGQSLDDYLFSAVISAFGFSNRADLAFQFYNALNKDKKTTLGIATYLSICQVLISANRIDDAVIVAIDMIGTGQIHPKQSTFNGLFRSLLKSEQIDADKKQMLIDKVVDTFWARAASKDESVLASFKAGTGSYAKFLEILMRHYARTKQYERVITLARRLELQNVSLSVFANNTILNFLFWEGKEELAMMLFDELCESAKKQANQTQTPESSSTTPRSGSINAHTLNIMLAHISKRKGTHSAITFFQTMRETHPEILPDNISYSTLIHACFKARMPAKAKELHREMTSLRLKPNLITCTALMDGLLKNNELAEAMKIFAWYQAPTKTESEQQTYEGPADQVMHTSAIHNLSYTKDSKTHVANAYNKFQELNEPPDIVLFNVLLHYFIRTKQSEHTEMMLMDMEHLHLEPDSYTSTAIVYGLIALGDYKAAEPAALKLIRNDMPITVHAITAVLKGLAKASRPVCMTRWIESFLPNGAKPITQSEAAVQELCTISKWTQKEQVLAEISENPDCAVLDKLREGCSDEPDFIFYQTCVMGFLRIGAVECADALTRHLLVRGGDAVDLRGPAASHLVERVAKKWNSLSDEKRGDDLRKVLKLHQ